MATVVKICFYIISLELVRDLLTSWADNQYSSGMLQEALTSGCLGPTGKLGKNIGLIDQRVILNSIKDNCLYL